MSGFLYKFVGGALEGSTTQFPMPIEEAPEHLSFALNADASPFVGSGQPPHAVGYHKQYRDGEWFFVFDPMAAISVEDFFANQKDAEFTTRLNEYTSEQLINNLVHRRNSECVVIQANGEKVQLSFSEQMPAHRMIALLKGAVRAIK